MDAKEEWDSFDFLEGFEPTSCGHVLGFGSDLNQFVRIASLTIEQMSNPGNNQDQLPQIYDDKPGQEKQPHTYQQKTSKFPVFQEQLNQQPLSEFPQEIYTSLGPEHPDHKQINKKNVLRNFGNAQNQYVLFHERARTIVQKRINEVQQFDSWVRGLKLEKFEHFRKLWKNHKNHLFRKVYKELCWNFYSEQAICYILNSRIKRQEMKKVHLKYIFKFMKGIQQPESFRCFRY